jgi:hypothetical protein
MAYTWYEEDVVQAYGVLLEGWVGPPFGNPSTMSTSLISLRKLADALKSNECAFRKLSPEEAKARKVKWAADVLAGLVVAKSRAQRSDAGVPRKRVQDEAEDDTPPPRKRARKSKKVSDDADSAVRPKAAPGTSRGRASAAKRATAKHAGTSRAIIESSDEEEEEDEPAAESPMAV